MARSFGPKGRTIPPAPREDFEFTVIRDEQPETHTFRAIAQMDTASLSYMLSSTEKHPERALDGMMRMIAKMLDNKDGTPAQWEPTPLSPPTTEGRAASGTYHESFDAEEQEVTFRGPDGQRYPMTEAARFTAPEAGSSKRRWLALMDDDVIVRAEDLGALFQWMVGLAAGRPTRPSS